MKQKLHQRTWLTLLLAIAAFTSTFAQVPVNPNATQKTKEVLTYIYNSKDQGFITGQHNYAKTWLSDTQMGWKGHRRVFTATGKYPGLWGSDFSYTDPNYTIAQLQTMRQKITDKAYDMWQNNSLVTMTYHMVNPKYEENAGWTKVNESVTEAEYLDIVTPGTTLYNNWKRNMDRIVPFLQELQDEGVVVVWRPYHEMNGIFWWGKGTGSNLYFNQLWINTYNYLVNTKGINNLIWFWSPNHFTSAGYQNPSIKFPGLQYVDILGLDDYYWNQSGILSQGDYDFLVNLAQGKPLAIGEGFNPYMLLPSPDWIKANRPEYRWLMVWDDDCSSSSTDRSKCWIDNRVNSAFPELQQNLLNLYNHADAINREDIDFHVPTAPTALSSPSKTSTSVNLTWTASTDNVGVTSYEVYTGNTLRGTTTTTSINITGLTSGTVYNFTVKAKDAVKNLSLASSVLSVTTNTDTGSANLVQNGSFESDLTNWLVTGGTGVINTANVQEGTKALQVGSTAYSWVQQNISGYTIGASYTFSAWGKGPLKVGIKTNLGNIHEHSFTSTTSYQQQTTTITVPSGATYLQVYVTNGSSGTEYADNIQLLSSSSDTQNPTAPIGLSSPSKTSTSVNLSWTASTDNVGVTGYEVFTGTTPRGSTTSTSIQVTGLTASTAYSFTVKAKDAANNYSAASSALSVTTNAASPAVNLIQNGGFESDLNNWSVTGGTGVITTTNVQGGAKALQVGSTAYSWVQQNISGYTVGDSYTFSAWGKGAVKVGIKTNLGNIQEFSFTSTTSYEQQTATITVPSGATYLQVYITNGSSGTEYADNIQLVSASASTQVSTLGSLKESSTPTTISALMVSPNTTLAQETDLVKNGGFESNLTDWELYSGDGVITTTNVQEGTKALEVGPTAFSQVQQNISGYTIGGTYTFSAWGKGAIRIGIKTNLNTIHQFNYTSTTTYEQQTTTITVPVGTTFLQVYVTNGSSGTEYADNIKLIANTPVPVSFNGDFRASADGNKAKLKWSVSSENKNDYFLIEKSFDGKIYSLVTKVFSKGNGANNYLAFDNEPVPGINYYKLSQFDTDGKSKVLDFNTLNFSLTSAATFSVYPNPASSKVTISYIAEVDENINLSVTDASGKTRISVKKEVSKGSNEIVLNTSELTNGVYFVTVSNGKSNMIKKLLIEN